MVDLTERGSPIMVAAETDGKNVVASGECGGNGGGDRYKSIAGR